MQIYVKANKSEMQIKVKKPYMKSW